MISLIRNEWMKIFSKVSSYIFIGFLVIAIVGSAFLVKSLYPDDWQAEQNEIIESNKEILADPDIDEEGKGYATESIAEAQATLDAGEDPNKVTTWEFMTDWVTPITSFVTLFAVIVCSASVSAEFSDGTIKQLLIRPHRRWKILLSKYITSTVFAGLMLIILIAVGYLVGLLFFEHSSYSDKMLDPSGYDDQTVLIGSYFLDMILYWLPGFIIIMTIAFMLSTLFKNQSIAVGISVFILFASSALNMLIMILVGRFEWLKFVIFPHLDLRIYVMDAEPMFEGATAGFSLAVLAVYYLLFMAITFVVFQKKDISI